MKSIISTLVLSVVLLLCISICKAENSNLEGTYDHATGLEVHEEEIILQTQLEEHDLPLSIQEERLDELDNEESEVLADIKSSEIQETNESQQTTLSSKLTTSIGNLIKNAVVFSEPETQEESCTKYTYHNPCGALSFLGRFIEKCKIVKTCSKTVGTL
jgi:TolA-binding protein